MTGICPGAGTSSPKAGHAAVVKYSAGLIASIFAAYDLAWLIPVIPLLSFSDQVLATFCASDPPAVVTLTSAEADAVLNLKFGADFDTGLQKVFNVYVNAVWYDACQCDAGTPTPFAPPAPPAGTPIIQPPVAPGVQPCAEASSVFGILNAGTAQDGAGFLFSGKNVTWILNTETVTGLIAPHTITHVMTWHNPTTGATLFTRVFTAATNGVAQTDSIQVPAGSTSVSSVWTLNTTNSPFATVTYDTKAYCNGDVPGGVQSPCCPPDIATQATLDIILKQVNLLQRQLAPFAYVPAGTHAGLTGTGNIEIAGILGISVTLTTLPGWIGDIAGTPDKLFDAGFVTFGTDDGYDATFRVDHVSRMFLPPRCSAYTDIGYSFPVGVTATIRELAREP